MELQPKINVEYPTHNKVIFEQWFAEHYDGCDTDRELLPFFPTSVWVNNNYGNDTDVRVAVQKWADELPRKQKYFVICQYDDGVLVNWRDLDVLEFNMSKNTGIGLPLLCQPKPISFTGGKKWFCNFIGSKTHPLREQLEYLSQFKDYYVSYEPHANDTYCRVLHESIFTLCPRGYGLNSFRIQEAIEFGSIPVWVSDEFIHPYDFDFNEVGITIHSENVGKIDDILQIVPLDVIIQKQNKLKRMYDDYYTYQGAFKKIINLLEAEYSKR